MCFSKEVSFVVGTTISACSYWYYLKFYVQAKKNPAKNKIKDFIQTLRHTNPEERLSEFSLFLILSFAAIGGHQFGQCFSILTGSQIIYKIGLISSILCTYFMIKAIERLSGKKLGSGLIVLTILFVILDATRTNMVFKDYHFWISGFNNTSWSLLWLLNWIYLCSAIVLLGYKAKKAINKKFYLLFALVGINISFIASWIYAIVAHHYGQVCNITNCTHLFLKDFNYRFDFPSLWCTFTIMQAPFIYLILIKARTSYSTETFGGWQPTWRTKLGLVAMTLVIVSIWYYVTPILLGVSWKMMAN